MKRRLFRISLILVIIPALILGFGGPVLAGPATTPLPYFEGSLYELVISYGISWYDANQAANAENGHLATITSQDEQDFLNAAFGLSYYRLWLGGYQLDNQLTPQDGWQWVTGEPWDYTNWNTGEPNDSMPGEDNEENHLVGWWSDDRWNDAVGNWGAAWGYIIEYESAAGFITGGGWIDSPPGAFPLAQLPLFDGSYYQLVTSPSMSWDDANAAANAMTLVGCDCAHLVTITSQEEQDALYALFGSALQGKWYGGFQEPGEIPPDVGWQWVTGEPWDYTNWAPREPNDAYGPGSELHLIGWSNGLGWNDEANLDCVTGYIVEYDDCHFLTGKANFGFNAKYNKNSPVPTGNLEFQFKAGDLNFHSSSYEWLWVSSDSELAVLKGSGTINGDGNYEFMLWVGASDAIRIRIWEEDGSGNQTIIYDNLSNTPLGGGSIVVHTSK